MYTLMYITMSSPKVCFLLIRFFRSKPQDLKSQRLGLNTEICILTWLDAYLIPTHSFQPVKHHLRLRRVNYRRFFLHGRSIGWTSPLNHKLSHIMYRSLLCVCKLYTIIFMDNETRLLLQRIIFVLFRVIVALFLCQSAKIEGKIFSSSGVFAALKFPPSVRLGVRMWQLRNR
jgi:hypothetical protein